MYLETAQSDPHIRCSLHLKRQLISGTYLSCLVYLFGDVPTVAGTALRTYSGVNQRGRLKLAAASHQSPARPWASPVTVTSACFLHVINLFLQVSHFSLGHTHLLFLCEPLCLHSFVRQLHPLIPKLQPLVHPRFFACARLRHPGDLTLWLHLVTDTPDLVIPTTSCFARLVLPPISPEQ